MNQFIVESSKILVFFIVFVALIYGTWLILQERASMKFLAMCSAESVPCFSSKPVAMMNYYHLKKYRFIFAAYMKKVIDREDFSELWQFVHQKDLLSGRKRKLCDSTYKHALTQTSACSLARIFSQGLKLYLQDGSHLILDDILDSLIPSNQAKKAIFLKFINKEIENDLLKRSDKADLLGDLYKEINKKLLA